LITGLKEKAAASVIRVIARRRERLNGLTCPEAELFFNPIAEVGKFGVFGALIFLPGGNFLTRDFCRNGDLKEEIELVFDELKILKSERVNLPAGS